MIYHMGVLLCSHCKNNRQILGKQHLILFPFVEIVSEIFKPLNKATKNGPSSIKYVLHNEK